VIIQLFASFISHRVNPSLLLLAHT